MQPRISTLLDHSDHTETCIADGAPFFLPTSVAPHKPLPVEPSPVEALSSHDDGRASKVALHNVFAGGDGRGSARRQMPQLHTRHKSSVPIAEVLNNERCSTLAPFRAPAVQPAPTAPFSGRLSDILIDPSQQYANKRRKVDEQMSCPTFGTNENTLLTLPKPHQAKKIAKRHRIPPLLQGLHQPPDPPPEGRLFPPITGEGSGFGRDIGEPSRVRLRSPALEKEREDKDNRDHVADDHADIDENNADQNKDPAADKDNSQTKETRKRNKWSEEETQHLLHGVSRFGIGNWKKILQCPDFTFHGRTAVDLKDRFRTCCPGEGLKMRKQKSRAKLPSRKEVEAEAVVLNMDEQTPVRLKPPRKARADTHRKGVAELAEMGIQRPFFKNNRRERREFTEKDDENLKIGFEKYGAKWHSMRDDPELGFATRHATDLRDRFRIRYTEIYAKAGYRLKPKEEMLLKGKDGVSSQESSSVGGEATSSQTKPVEEEATTEALATVATTATSSNPTRRTHTFFQPLLTRLPSSFDDFNDRLSEDDGEGGHTPITLNRNILQWADANPSQANPATAPTLNMPTVANLTGDMGLSYFSTFEAAHSNPLANLQSSNQASLLSTYPQTSTSGPFLLPATSANTNTATSTLTSAPTSAPNATNPPSKHTISSFLRTPNLPTIVFPHVPVASARNTVHNLPPPADLLSGMDLDVRLESSQNQNNGTGNSLDEISGWGFSGSTTSGFGLGSTLAPIMNGNGGTGLGMGRGVLGFERGLLEEPFGERSLLNSSI